jgi:hypothetical protein
VTQLQATAHQNPDRTALSLEWSRPVQRHRPGFLTLLAILSIIGGAFLLLVGLAGIGLGGFAASYGQVPEGTNQPLLGAVLIGGGSLALLGGAINLIFGIGTLAGKAWAWILGIIGYALSALSGLWTILSAAFQGQVSSIPGGTVLGVLVAGVLFYYLNTDDVKRYFGRA